jgi:hemoglobin/transferrin/lactoferrin receptor protein
MRGLFLAALNEFRGETVMTSDFRKILLAGAATALLASASPASAQAIQPTIFNIPSQPLGAALAEFARQSNIDVLFSSQLTRNQQSPGLQGEMAAPQALAMLLSGTGLTYRASSGGSFVIEDASDPQSGSAAWDGAEA